MPRKPNCRRCSLSQGVNHVCLWGQGSRRAEIMLVGEAPGEIEDAVGAPFLGAAGKQLDKCLKLAGLKRLSVYITNIIKCRPPDNRDPTAAEIGACFRYLAEEIDAVQPKVIICLGRWSLKALTGEDSIARARGRLLTPLSKIHIGSAKVIATYHPAAYLYSHKQSVLDAIVEDLKSASNVAHPKASGGGRVLLTEGYTAKALANALASLESATELACDLEWLAVPDKPITWPWTPSVGVLSISFTGRVESELRTVALAWPVQLSHSKALRAFIRQYRLIFHNAMADVIWLLSLGVRPKIAGDTMLLAYLLDEQRRAGLKGLGPLVAGVESGWERKPWHRRPTTEAGWQELLDYNAGDSEATLRISEAMLEQVDRLKPVRARNIKRVYKRLLLRCVVPFAQMAVSGTPIAAGRLQSEIRRHTVEKRRSIQALSEATSLRLDTAERLAGSPQQVTRFAREAFGLDVDSSREDALADYAKQYPPLAHIQAFRHERKMLSTYLEPWGRLIQRQSDSRLHNIYLLGATRTGRLSAEIEEGGSLLLTPRDGWARDLISADPGWDIHAADYSQIELRMVAWLAPERTMRRLYAEGADLHQATAAYVKGFAERRWTVAEFWAKRHQYMSAVTKNERQGAKGLNFGLDFGMQPPAFQVYVHANYGVDFTLEEAELAHKGYFTLYSDLQAWHDKCRAAFDRGLPTLTPFGRYRFDISDVTQQINTPIQSTASDLTIFAVAVIAERLAKEVGRTAAEVIGFVHDCILVHAKRSVRAQVREIIQTTMEHPPLELVGIKSIPVPLVAKVKTGKTWAEAS